MEVERRSGEVTLRSALLVLVATAALAGVVPAGLVLDQRLARELELRARRDVAQAPSVIAARDAALHDAMMMHAKELAQDPALAAAVRAGDRAAARGITESTARRYSYNGVVLGADASVWAGPAGAAGLTAATRAGDMPVRVVSDDAGLHLVSVVGVTVGNRWWGAAGVALPLDAAAAGGLAALTHSDAVLLLAEDGRWVAAPADSAAAAALAAAWLANGAADDVGELSVGNGRYVFSTASLGGATALFVRDLRRELALLPILRRVLLATGAGAVAAALLLGFMLAARVARPVRQLAVAADGMTRGEFDTPLPQSRVEEVARVTEAFGAMRRTLNMRMEQLRSANRLLEERQARLASLQAELIKRERVATSARMAAELAHEVRNPIANIRNCLELLERRLAQDREGREFAALAVEELLRMHELSERMLHLNRPQATAEGACDVGAVARDVIALSELGQSGRTMRVLLEASGPAAAAIPADALKQVLLNLVQNARDAVPHGLVLDVRTWTDGSDVHIQVRDNGPGIPEPLRERIFDPFFTTRTASGGVGLGLFLVEGIVRGYGGRVALLDNAGTAGACFELTLPRALTGAIAPSAHRNMATVQQ